MSSLASTSVLICFSLEERVFVRQTESGFGFAVKPVSHSRKKSQYDKLRICSDKTCRMTSLLFVHHALCCLLLIGYSICQINLKLVSLWNWIWICQPNTTPFKNTRICYLLSPVMVSHSRCASHHPPARTETGFTTNPKLDSVKGMNIR